MPHTRPMHSQSLRRCARSILGRFAWLAALALVSTSACSKENADAAPPNVAPMVTISSAASRDVPTYLDEIGKKRRVRIGHRYAAGRRPHHRAALSGWRAAQEWSSCFSRSIRAPIRRNSTPHRRSSPRAARLWIWPLTQLKMYAVDHGRPRISQLDYETKKNTVAVDQAQVQAAEAAVENAKLNLEYCYIHSPIDGRAGARLVDVGNVVQANTTPLLLDPAPRSHLRGLHHHGSRSARSAGGRWPRGRCRRSCGFPRDPAQNARRRHASSSSTTPCRTAPAR